MQTVVDKSGQMPNRAVEACAVLAMARHQVQHADQAKLALAQAIELADTKLPKLDSGDIGGGWIDWIFAHAVLREARSLIEGKAE
jgi:hypothetical protein